MGTKDEAMLEVGNVIDGKYKILNVIGNGGMSTVYLAINEKANKPWAIKEVRKDGVKDFEIVRQSLLVETKLLKNLSHKGLPSIIDVIDEGDNFLIVMDYIEGMTLKEVLREKGAQPQEKVVDWAKQLCEVLKYLHNREQPIIYRDMKPSNIMLRTDGSVVLIDFGTAREFKARNTADTTCLGTQGYAAPEQFGGRGQTDARTDIYSLGATMYHLVTGHNPSEPPYEMYPITRWNPGLSTGLEHVIEKCTQRNPADRFQSADELLYALEHYRDYDIGALAGYRKKVAIFISTIILAGILIATSVCTGKMAGRQLENQYEYLCSVAQKSPEPESELEYYMQAIAMNCTRSEAYLAMTEIFAEDANFTVDEEEVLIRLNISVEKYLTEFALANEEGYADFCYRIGTLYWFYYEREENRRSNAVKWFEQAVQYYDGNPEKELELKRCRLYIEIGTFYKKVMMAQIEGNDGGMYSQYWRNLMELKRNNEEKPDREIIILRLYNEIAGCITEYARYLMEEGITQQELEQVISDMSEDMDRMEAYVGSRLRTEIAQTRMQLENAENMIISSIHHPTVELPE